MNTSEQKQHGSIRVYGRVQGVLFRRWTRRQAIELRLTGTVQNDPDGTVSIEVEGRKEDLQEFERRCHKGPFLARVDTVDMEWGTFQNRYSQFIIKW